MKVIYSTSLSVFVSVIPGTHRYSCLILEYSTIMGGSRNGCAWVVVNERARFLSRLNFIIMHRWGEMRQCCRRFCWDLLLIGTSCITSPWRALTNQRMGYASLQCTVVGRFLLSCYCHEERDGLFLRTQVPSYQSVHCRIPGDHHLPSTPEWKHHISRPMVNICVEAWSWRGVTMQLRI